MPARTTDPQEAGLELLDLSEGKSPARRAATFSLVCGLIATIAVLVHAGGGTMYPYVNLSYPVIILGAFLYGPVGGAAVGLVLAAIVGPLMPLEVATATSQPVALWLTRLVVYVLVGGATGYLFKSLRTALQATRQRYRTDPTTTLPNTNALLQELADPLRRPDCDVSLQVVHLQAMEDLRAVYGEETAARLIRRAAARLRRELSPTALFRLSGDQFAFWLSDQPYDKVRRATKRAVEHLNGGVSISGVCVDLQPCAGVARAPAHARSPDELVRCGLFAVRTARELGRSYMVYDAERYQRQHEVQTLLPELRAAVNGTGLELHYQPKIGLASGGMEGAEALLRWRHPTRGYVPPGRFIPLIERTALMDEVTGWVLRAGFRQAARWTDANATICINLSVRNLRSEQIVEEVEELAQFHGLAPDRIEFEVTESEIMQEWETANLVFRKLRDRGFRIGIDDFGTGQSSLSYLRQIPADVVKLDRSFIDRIAIDAPSQKIVRRVVELCHDLDLYIVAEGIETSAAADLLREVGCDSAQGYYFAKPMPADALLAFSAETAAGAAQPWTGR